MGDRTQARLTTVLGVFALALAVLTVPLRGSIALSQNRSAGPFQEGLSYTVAFAGTGQTLITVLEAGPGAWIKVRDKDGDVYWLNSAVIAIAVPATPKK